MRAKINHLFKSALFTAALLPTISFACPLCHSTTAQQVRAGLIATSADASVIFALTAPFFVIGLVLSALELPFFNTTNPEKRKTP